MAGGSIGLHDMKIQGWAIPLAGVLLEFLQPRQDPELPTGLHWRLWEGRPRLGRARTDPQPALIQPL